MSETYICDGKVFKTREAAERYAAALDPSPTIQTQSEATAANQTANKELWLAIGAIPLVIVILLLVDSASRDSDHGPSERQRGWNDHVAIVASYCEPYKHDRNSDAHQLCARLLGASWVR